MPGGVCAVLDYEVEQMADYVSEMATRIVLPHKNVNSAFRKFVSQILTSTRLPSTTILLGMNYLAKRINTMHAAGQTNHNEGQVWRMLTVALLLGSKFLDDNTFQNKSWSEVSGISVQELNTLEYEWLSATNWGLYVNLDESKDYNAWLANWREWLATKERQQAQATRDRLASLSPVDSDMGRARKLPAVYSTWHQQQVAEYERLSNKRHQPAPPSAAPYRRDQQWAQATPWRAAPLTPPDSVYGTPEYPNSVTSLNSHYNEWFDRAVANGSMQRNYHQSAPYGSFHHPSSGNGSGTRSYAAFPSFYQYSHSIWDAPNTADCHCGNCGSGYHKPPSYFAQTGYGQPVAG